MLEQLTAAFAKTTEYFMQTWDFFAGNLFDIFVGGMDWFAKFFLPETVFGAGGAQAWLYSGEFEFTFRIALAVVLALVVLLLGARIFRRARRLPGASLGDVTKRPRFYGVVGICALLMFLGGWSALAPLASAAIAPGIVSPEGNRKTVEHLEGGIVKKIHVSEGDKVLPGQPLVTLENVQAKSQYAQLQTRYLHLRATEARLSSERARAASIEFPVDLVESEDPEAEHAIDAQTQLFNSHNAKLESHKKILAKRVSQLREQNYGFRDVLSAQGRQLDLLDMEIEDVQTLLDSGLERRPRLLTLRRAKAELEAEQASVRAQIAENELKIGETEIQLLNLAEQFIDNANDELADVQRVLSELKSQLPSREDVLYRTIIRAPLAGTVMNVKVTTESGVIAPGEPILEIVPQQASLIVDAKVRPSDIDRVHAGMEARVLLTAYKQRNLPLIRGTLKSISADRLVEDRTGESFFLAKVEVREDDLQGIGSVRMIPGMPAEVMILDAERTLLAYLVEPLLQSLNKSFREN